MGLGVLADDNEVMLDCSAGSGAKKRALVDVQIEFEAHLEQ